jgi:hypothetical protein
MGATTAIAFAGSAGIPPVPERSESGGSLLRSAPGTRLVDGATMVEGVP